MGLGKTVQALAAILRDHQEGNERPNLPVMFHHGPGRERGEQFAQRAADHQIVITSYGTMTRDLESWPETDRIMARGYTPGNQG